MSILITNPANSMPCIFFFYRHSIRDPISQKQLHILASRKRDAPSHDIQEIRIYPLSSANIPEPPALRIGVAAATAAVS